MNRAVITSDICFSAAQRYILSLAGTTKPQGQTMSKYQTRKAGPFYLLFGLSSLLLLHAAPAHAGVKVGTLTCDVSAGIGLVVVEKQTLSCVFQPDRGGPGERYTGQITEFGITLRATVGGYLVWGVIAGDYGLPAGALAGTYAGAGADASFGVGAGANVLIGGTGRAFSLQPISVEGQAGVNVAGGVTAVTLVAAP